MDSALQIKEKTSYNYDNLDGKMEIKITKKIESCQSAYFQVKRSGCAIRIKLMSHKDIILHFILELISLTQYHPGRLWRSELLLCGCI